MGSPDPGEISRPSAQLAACALPTTISLRRIAAVCATVVYVASFHSVYRDLVVPQQGGYGAGYRALSPGLMILIYSACIVPSFWMPVRLKRPSQLLFYIQYYLVFVPAAFMVFYLDLPQLTVPQATSVLLWMFAGLLVLEGVYQIPLVRFRPLSVEPRLFWACVCTVGVGLLADVILVSRGNFQIANLAQVYDVRTAQGELISASGSHFVVYAQAWMDNLVLPLAFAFGVFGRRWWMAVCALLGYLFVYGVSGQKIALLAIAYLPGFYVILRKRDRNVPAALAVAFSALLLASYAVEAWLPPVVSIWYTALIDFRTFAIQGLNLGQYYSFFLNHPVTHLSHLGVVRWFVHYPYQLGIDYTLGDYFYNTMVGNNSGMWAADAIAGFGTWSIPVISALAAGIFWLLDCCAAPFDPRFVALLLAYIGTTFANVSLGTTFVTGGVGLLCVFFLVLPQNEPLAWYMRRGNPSAHQLPVASSSGGHLVSVR